MKLKTAFIAAAAAGLLASAAAPQNAGDLLGRMARVNAGLASYKVPMSLDVDLHRPLPLSLPMRATYYYKQPDRTEVVFENVPDAAQAFKHVYASLGAPSTWEKKFDVTLAGTTVVSGRQRATLRLVPKDPGALKDELIGVDVADAVIVHAEWRYNDGGTILMDQQNERVREYVLPRHQTATVNLSAYDANVKSTFGDYELNVDFPDSVFTK